MGVIDNCQYGVGNSIIALTIPFNFNFPEWASIFWSGIPYALMALFILGYFTTRRLTFLILALTGLIGSGINEIGLKNVRDEARPYQSCITSSGLPSGHALNAMSLWAFIILELLTRPRVYITMRRRIFLIVMSCICFLPCGPFRAVIHDHTWKQIGVGMAAGAIWGTIVWLFSRFILARFFLEKLMSMGWVRKVIRNDFDHEFLYSKYKGTKCTQPPLKDTASNVQSLWKRGLINAIHTALIVVNFLLGCFGIVAGFLKDNWDPTCDRAAPGTILAVGCYCILISLIMIPVTIFVNRKLNGSSWWAFGVKMGLFASAFLILEALFFAIGGIVATTDSQSCPSDGADIGVVFFVVWFIVEGLLLLIYAIIYYRHHLRRLYGSRKSLVRNGGEPNNIEMGNPRP